MLGRPCEFYLQVLGADGFGVSGSTMQIKLLYGMMQASHHSCHATHGMQDTPDDTTLSFLTKRYRRTPL
jgi:hypothetical protein